MNQLRNYPDYGVTEAGNIFSYKSNRWLKVQTMKNGYKRIMLSVSGKPRRVFVHRLVAETYISNPSNKPNVNHKDSNRGNNASWNLEWVTPKENTAHMMSSGNWKGRAKVTHCINGHEYIAQTTYVDKKGAKNCRTCKNLRERRKRAEQRERNK